MKKIEAYIKQHRVDDVAHNTAGALAIYVGGFAAFMVLGLFITLSV